MDKLISIYRIVDGVETMICTISKENASLSQSIMDKDKVTLSVVTEDPLYLAEGDYILLDGVKYRINRDPEDKQSSEKEHSYDISFEAPIYTLIDKIYCNKITGSTTVTLTGKLRDFLELLIWNINYDVISNPLGVDTGWEIGLCPDTDYMNLTLETTKCRDALDSFASKFELEYYVTNKTINFVSHIENETGLVFTQGEGKGLYEVERKNVDDGDLVTRVYVKGGTENITPGEGDSDGRLMLPEGYIENFSESQRGVEAVVVFDSIHPTFQGSVGNVSGDNNREFLCPEVDFDIADVAVGDEARVNFLTGDLMGKSFEFKWDNSLKKITLIYQEDDLAAIDPNTGSRPNIPSSSKYLRGGELFNFTGLKLSGTYKTNAITKLREKGADWLAYYCRKRVKFELNVDYRYLRKNNTELHCGDLITINVPLHNISKLIRITAIERNLYTGKLTCTVSNYLDEKWKDKIEDQIAEIKTSTATINGGYGGATVTILENNDEREPSDNNVFSALRTLKEIIERALSRKNDDSAAGLITFIKGLVSEKIITAKEGVLFGNFLTGECGAKLDANGDAEVRNIIARIKARIADLEVTNAATAKTVTVSDKVTTLNLLVKELAEIYNLDVSNVATLFRTIIKDYVSSETFIAGLAGEGFKLYKALSGDWNLELDNLTIRKAMTIFELIISKIRSVNGGLVVSQANGRVKSVNEDTTNYVLGIEGDMTFEADDFVRCQVFGTIGAKYYWVRVVSVSGDSISIPKSEFPEGTVPAVGDDLVQMGNKTNTARQGILYLTASEDGKPRFSVLDGVDSTDLTGKNKLILGCLDGITDSDFPSDAQPSGYGLWAVNVFLKGLFILRNGKSVEDELSDQITAVRTAFEIREGQISSKVTEATTAAINAGNSAILAQGYANTAGSKASDAAGSATIAGQKASDAQAAADDASNILSSVIQKETSINQTAQAIELKAVRAESAAGRAENAESSINLKADGIVLQASNQAAQTAVNGVQIGGRNLALNSDVYISNVEYNIRNYNLSQDLIAGETYTATIWGSLYPSKSNFGMWMGGGYTGVGGLSKIKDGVYQATFTMPNSVEGDGYRNVINIYTVPYNIVGISTIYKFKLEQGNKSTDWTPAFEDVKQDATDKANAAENNAKTYSNDTFTTKTELSAQLTILNNSISSKVSQTDFYALGSRVSSAETTISQHASQIALKASQSDLTTLGTRITSAEAKITPDAINLTVKSQTQSLIASSTEPFINTSLNLVDLDSGTYYPVSVYVDPTSISYITVTRGLFGRENTASWSAHPNGFALNVKWSTNGSGWGTIAIHRTFYDADCRFVNAWPIGNIGQNDMGSVEIFYLRGGSSYSVVTQGKGIGTPQLNPSGYTWSSGSYNFSLPTVTSLDSTPSVTYKTIAEIQAGISIVAGGISIFGNELSFAGKVTFSSLAGDTQNKITTAQSTADAANSTAGSALSSANAANADLSTLKGNLGSLAYQSMVSLAKLDTTIVEGGYIKTSLINASAIVTGALLANVISATDITTGKLTVTDGAKIGDFYVTGNYIRGVASNTSWVELHKDFIGLYNWQSSAQTLQLKEVTQTDQTGVYWDTFNLVTTQAIDCRALFVKNYMAIGNDLTLGGAIKGFAPNTTRTAATTINMTVESNWITATASAVVRLPPSPKTGHFCFVNRGAHALVTVYGNGHDICRTATSTLGSIPINTDGQTWIFVFDGTYWIAGYLNN